MARQTFKIEGLKELDEALSELPKATERNILKRALTNAGKPIADDAEREARKLSGKLKRSFGVNTKLSRRQKSKLHKESAVEVYAGPGALAQAITEEFGTSSQAAHPTMRPSWDRNKMRSLGMIRDEIKIELDKAIARAERKAARIAAKIKT